MVNSNIKLELPGVSGTISVTGRGLGRRNSTGSPSEFLSPPEVLGIGAFKGELQKRDWLVGSRDYYDEVTGTLRTVSPGNISPSEVPRYASSTGSTKLGGIFLMPTDRSDGDLSRDYQGSLKEFTMLYNRYIMKKEDNEGEYWRIVSVRDILDGKSEICFLCPKDGTYTNVLDINSIQGHPTGLRLGVGFTKGGVVYNKEVILDPKISSQSRTPDFIIEYSDRCVRVFPGSPEISECILSYCYLTYEHLI